ncbi:MAG: TatD family deoxyribonuclease [Saprospirales bacterium]|nr:MAG: TatD family deoxyribonuclease [Saprospirales bacterium]
MLIDSHSHLYVDAFLEDIDAVIERAKEAGVEKIVLPNIDKASLQSMFDLAEKHPHYCLPAVGLHPCSVKEDYRSVLEGMEGHLGAEGIIAVGETGIDMYWDKTTLEIQQEAFRIQINWAKEKNLPIIIHSRDSLDLTISEIEGAQDGRLKGIFHCFTGNLDQVKKIRDLGFFMGLGGVVTYKNGGMDKILPYSGLDNMILETDAPYLAPVPFRGKRNEPAYLKNIAERVSELSETTYDEVIQKTGLNCLKVFGKQIHNNYI